MSVFFKPPWSSVNPPPAAPAPADAEIVNFAKEVSRLRGIRLIAARRRPGYLIDIGERYLVLAHPPEVGEYVEVDGLGRCRRLKAGG